MVITNSGLWADLIVPCELHSPTPATVDWVDAQPTLDQGASSQGIGKQAWRIPVLVWIIFKERRCKFENYVSLWNREWRKQMCRKGEKKRWFREECRERWRAVERRDEKRDPNALEPSFQSVLRPVHISAPEFYKVLPSHACVLLLMNPPPLGLSSLGGFHYTRSRFLTKSASDRRLLFKGTKLQS